MKPRPSPRVREWSEISAGDSGPTLQVSPPSLRPTPPFGLGVLGCSWVFFFDTCNWETLCCKCRDKTLTGRTIRQKTTHHVTAGALQISPRTQVQPGCRRPHLDGPGRSSSDEVNARAAKARNCEPPWRSGRRSRSRVPPTWLWLRRDLATSSCLQSAQRRVVF